MSVNSKYPKEAGIYKLTCSNNGKVYIGKSVNIYQRLIQHKHCETKSNGDCYFEHAIRKYGWDSFSVEILEIFKNFDKINDNIALLEKESHYIKLFDSTDRSKGYNRCSYSSDTTGRVLTEEHKLKIGKAHLGMKRSEETKQKMRQNNLGKTLTEDHKEKLRQAKLGTFRSEETKKKISETLLKKQQNKILK